MTKTHLASTAQASRDELVVQLVPAGAKPDLPAAAPPAGSWQADFGDEPDAAVLLRGERGERWLLLRMKKDCGVEEVREAAGRGRNQAESLKRGGVTLDLSLLPGEAALAKAAAEAAGMASYDPAVLKSERKKPAVKRITVVVPRTPRAAAAAVKAGALAAQANLATRELQNLPSNVLTPKEFAARARKLVAGQARFTAKVFGQKQMEAMKMGALLGVARGSRKEPQLVHLSYRPRGRSKGKVAVVGKGLIFDSGGISIKPAARMDEMKFDMSGAAAVYGLFHALVHGADCPYEVHGVLGCVENMPGGNAQNPGDIVTAMNGKTIEVLNTDAEGRLVLADCLSYAARRVKPDRIYDLATLTGAAAVALGHNASAILGNDDALRDEVQAAGERSGERCWPLPLWEVHKDLLKGTYADLQNIYPPTAGAGTIAGAAFLSQFVDELPWVHLDIAATAWEGPARSYFSAGGRAVGVRLLLELLSA